MKLSRLWHKYLGVIYIFTQSLNSLIRKQQPGLTPWQTSVNHLPIRQEKITKRLIRGIILEPHDPIMNLFVGPLGCLREVRIWKFM